MTNRWAILALLFSARCVMGFQFQSVAALAPEIRTVFGVGLDGIGLVFGLYMVPGLVLALPGAVAAQRTDAKALVVVGLGLMTAGAALMAMTSLWGTFLAGHVMAGVGGVLLNVLMTRMVTDWFDGRELTTALALFINSWPTGIMLALVILPLVGLTAGLWLSGGAALCACVAVAAYYRRAAVAAERGTVAWGTPGQRRTALAAGIVWGAFNAGLALTFGLGPALLIENGLSVAASGRLTSVILLTTAVVAPFGGLVVDRFGRRDPIIAVGLLGLGGLIVLAALAPPTIILFAVIGATSGFIAGPIMSLPGAALPPAVRTTGMGLFFTMYYGAIVAGPALGGTLAEAAGTAKAALVLGAALQIVAVIGLALYRRATLRE